MNKLTYLFFCAALCCTQPVFALSADRAAALESLALMDLEALQEVEVYNPAGGLAARKKQNLLATPAALFVISQTDIRRGGFTSIPEALRMVPGMQVARIDGNKWAISARGFNSRFAGKLLVMIDGRTVYSLLRSEVYWDVQDTLLEDVERIEVLRGPGAALWGANAVNGIINIVTKAAAQTQGVLASVQAGSAEERAVVGLRYGGKLGKQGHYRVYGKSYDFDFMATPTGDNQDSRWRNQRAGFRTDWQLGEYDSLTVQGDGYDGWTNQETKSMSKGLAVEKIAIAGHNLLARWYRETQRGGMSVQAYYDWNERHEPDFEDSRGTLDVDFQHRLALNPRAEFIWGLGYRRTWDEINGSATQYYTPAERTDDLYSTFAHLDYALIPEHLRLVVGSKLSWDSYAGVEIQPNARLLWQLTPTHQLWAALSRAVRTPSRTDEDFNLLVPMGKNMNLRLQGDDDFKSEEIIAYELGWRFTPGNGFLLDAALFFNQYDQLGPFGASSGFVPPNTVVQTITNGYEGHTFGLELAAHWQVLDNWKLSAAYHYFDMNLDPMPGIPSGKSQAEGATPPHQASIRSILNLTAHWQWDNALYYVDNIPKNTIANYLRFDTRLAWLPANSWEIALGVRNLLDDRHPEFNTDIGEVNGEVPRTFYFQLKYAFGE